MRHPVHPLRLARLAGSALALLLSACTADPDDAGGPPAVRTPGDPVPAFLQGTWKERLPPGIHFGGSRTDFTFAPDSLLFTVHGWTDVIVCEPGGPPRCSSPNWDHVYSAGVYATDSTLALDWLLLRTTASGYGESQPPRQGRTEFRLTRFGADDSLALEESGRAGFPGGRALVLERTKP